MDRYLTTGLECRILFYSFTESPWYIATTLTSRLRLAKGCRSVVCLEPSRDTRSHGSLDQKMKRAIRRCKIPRRIGSVLNKQIKICKSVGSRGT
jgi:hypothetical protein